MEKLFPVYAMGLSKAVVGGDFYRENFDSVVSDPMWDAVREEAKVEVLFFPYVDALELFWWV